MSQSTTAQRSLAHGQVSSALLGGVPLLGRILISAIFLISGVGKITAPAATIGFIASVGLPLPKVGYAIAVFIEIVGGIALAGGHRTRLAAAALAVFSVAAALGFHNHLGDQNQFIHFFKNLAMCGGLLQIVAFGAGRFSVDSRTR